MLVGLAGAPMYAAATGAPWSLLEYVVSALLALDLFGGVAVNASGAAKRWYHRPGQGSRQQMGFIALHGLHIAAVGLLFRESIWPFFLVVYSILLFSALLVIVAPPAIQRPVAFLTFLGACFASIYCLGPTPHLQWFLPVLFMKLLVAHLVVEHPYPPAAAA
jgi:hypothetical protein